MLLISSRNAPPTGTGRHINLHTNLLHALATLTRYSATWSQLSDGPGQDRGGEGEAPAGDVRRARGGEHTLTFWALSIDC